MNHPILIPSKGYPDGPDPVAFFAELAASLRLFATAYLGVILLVLVIAGLLAALDARRPAGGGR